MAKEIPVYLFSGFLESGKTTFIQGTLGDKRFNNGESILVIMCEEGEVELDPGLFSGNNVHEIVMESEDELTPENFKKLEKKYKPERVMIECNGMWLIDNLYQALPENWTVYQEMMFAEAKTFITYNTNMRTHMVDKLRGCELVVLNRAYEDVPKEEIHKIVRGISRRASIVYEYPDGNVEYDEIEDPLPFDIEAPVIEIKDTDYAIWYRDLTEDLEKYDGKAVTFKGITAKDSDMDDKTFVVGRHVMTCCAEDITYTPLVAVCKSTVDIKSREWVKVTGKLVLEFNEIYGNKGPVLYVDELIKTSAPTDEVATFY